MRGVEVRADLAEGAVAPPLDLEAVTPGQTFVTPPGETRLDSFSFWVLPGTNSQSFQYQARVMAWNGRTMPTGELLWSSALVSGITSDDPVRVTFDVGGLVLSSDQQYVAFLMAANATGVAGQHYGRVLMANEGSFYRGGRAYVIGNYLPDGVEGLTFLDWQDRGDGFDFAFTADFSSTAAVVPEPGAVLLLGSGLGLLGLGAARRRLIGPRKSTRREHARFPSL